RSTATNSSCGTVNTLRNHPTAPRNKTSSPTTLTAKLVTKPAKMRVSPKAVTNGHAVGAGTSTPSLDVFARLVSGSISSSTLQRPMTYTTVNTITQTASTKCQYH